MNFEDKYKSYLEDVVSGLKKYLPEIRDEREKIYNAMEYSLFAGGKRIRPVLALAVCEMLGKNVNEVMPYAVAIEMIHTYSLIHDDLPSMDNDDLRRGKPTNHKVFGEGMAILAGDALLNLAYEIMANDITKNKEKSFVKAKALAQIANSAGINGMIGGQVIDIESGGKIISEDILKKMHSLKTGELLKAPVIAASYICEAKTESIEALTDYASYIGLAFQIKDDILDVEGNVDKLGKPIGSDVSNEKSTFVSMLGLENSKELLQEVTNEAIVSLNIFGTRADFLVELAKNLAKRDN